MDKVVALQMGIKLQFGATIKESQVVNKTYLKLGRERGNLKLNIGS